LLVLTDLIISIWLTPFLVTASFLLTEGFPDLFLPGHYQTVLTADSSLATGPELSLGSSAFTQLNSTFTDSNSTVRAIFSSLSVQEWCEAVPTL